MLSDTRIYIKYTTEGFREKIKDYIQTRELIVKRSLDPLDQPSILRKLEGIVVEIYGNLAELEMLLLSKNNFLPQLPIIGVVHENHWELIRMCGKIGIDRVISLGQLHLIDRYILELSHYAKAEVKLNDISVSKQKYLYGQIQRTLQVIEDNYLNISTTEELCSLVNVNRCYLSEQFQHHKLCSPKRVLMCMKLRHALNLLSAGQFTLAEISNLSGFSDYQHFRRWSNSIFNQSPKTLSQHVRAKGAENFWQTYGPSLFTG